ncbi:MAG: hypothetical protein LBN00_06765, partial [Oscillospiraceae bacterium]|nr:hypothetical protein [Oscillospiraceae bacterium]
KWETGASLPDITQIPALANIFDTSADVLLGIDLTAKEKRVQEIYDEADALYKNGFHNAAAAEVLRAGLKEFPNSHKLMSGLMTRLWMERENDKPEPVRDEMTQEVIRLGEKILAESTDDECRHNAIQILCFVYPEPEVGQREKAVALAEKMPDTLLSRQHLMSHIYNTGDKGAALREDLIFSNISNIITTMRINFYPHDDGSPRYTAEESITIERKILALIDLMFEDGNYGYFRGIAADEYREMAASYSRHGDNAAAIDNLKLAAEHFIKSDEQDERPNEQYTSLLFRGKEIGVPIYNMPYNNAQYLLTEMEKTDFDALRGSAEFREIQEELKKHAKLR